MTFASHECALRLTEASLLGRTVELCDRSLSDIQLLLEAVRASHRAPKDVIPVIGALFELKRYFEGAADIESGAAHWMAVFVQTRLHKWSGLRG